jgi:hypothetical protein
MFITHEVTNAVIQVSSILSILGSCAVMYSWAYPRSNRQKPGRILLLWLSFADLMTSNFYFIQTFNYIRNSEVLCKACALIDIFFPVAAFLWTDFIAYYIYLVVHARLSSHTLQWDKLLPRFHLIVWSLSCVILLAVLLTDHAGT